MSELAIFGLGFSIFSCYLFFLSRMIWKQHAIQKRSDTNIIKIESEEKKKAS